MIVYVVLSDCAARGGSVISVQPSMEAAQAFVRADRVHRYSAIVEGYPMGDESGWPVERWEMNEQERAFVRQFLWQQ